MYSFIYWFYFITGYYYKRNKNMVILFFVRCSYWLCNHYFNGFLIRTFINGRSKKNGITKVKREQKVIASLTSYPARIDTTWIAIETILRQSVKADEVLLWLADSQFEGGMDSLPAELLAQTNRGLTIRFCDDLRSHKKYYYTMKEYPGDLILLFDDDAFYPKDLIKRLLKENKKVPDNIICSSSSTFHRDNILNPIIWEPTLDKTTGVQCSGINNVSGTLFPPKSLNKNVFDKEKIKEIAPKADDLWLTAAAYMQGTKLTTLRYRQFPFPIAGSQKESLYASNNFDTSEINNNTQWRAILRCYREELSNWLKKFRINDNGFDLSIIIPIYNLEDYIDNCIQSVLGCHDLLLEILLIDDGSTDNSPRICDEYAAKYHFIKVIHKKNEGAAAARNIGIRRASGAYVMFIDGDDFLTFDILRDITWNLDGETELFTFHFYEYYEEDNVRNEITHIAQSSLYDRKGNITKDIFYSVPTLPMPWLYLLKRDFILKNALYMKIGILDEDEEWCARVFANLRKAKVLDLYAYNYRRNRLNSLTYGRKFENIISDLKIIDILIKEAKKNKYNKRQKHILHNKCRELIKKIVNEKAAHSSENQATINKHLKSYRSMLLGGSKAEIVMYFLSLLFGWEKAKKILQKLVSFKSED